MSASSPSHLNLDRLKREARDLLSSFNTGDDEAISRVQSHLRRLRESGETSQQDRPVGLQEAQFVVARERGFENWSEIRLATNRPTRAAIPVLVVPDLKSAIDFYTSKLGFTAGWDYPDPPTYASVAFGDAEIHLSEVADIKDTGTDVWLYLQVQDVDDFYDWLVSNGVEVEGPPEQRPWGMREIVATDLNGYRFHIGSSTE
ncbi:MAG: VOC family protein [Gemmatimonadetes bacterium]|jgi:uncharacterized glyoxalase superfamily protein PhnB|nr:VOC family protein [Gemmatimonadota bacterium]MBT4609490.1 VOC family protein [Gemmatimonadota bacterium]MBT5057911.1 VOC family protein [Gemmatimonadota bacterium]MBT5144351.1 VOC family protein [Gemmatimonadota bacterium]MBT5587131.1 VOC family protein [Gemmatimonadota bacterium]